MAHFENSLMAYLACFQQNAKQTARRCSLLHHQYITQNDVYHKINDVTNVPVYLIETELYKLYPASNFWIVT